MSTEILNDRLNNTSKIGLSIRFQQELETVFNPSRVLCPRVGLRFDCDEPNAFERFRKAQVGAFKSLWTVFLTIWILACTGKNSAGKKCSVCGNKVQLGFRRGFISVDWTNRRCQALLPDFTISQISTAIYSRYMRDNLGCWVCFGSLSG